MEIYNEKLKKIYIYIRIYIISPGILLRMENVSGKLCRENQNTFYVQ